jgi:hypothetical protein
VQRSASSQIIAESDSINDVTYAEQSQQNYKSKTISETTIVSKETIHNLGGYFYPKRYSHTRRNEKKRY